MVGPTVRMAERTKKTSQWKFPLTRATIEKPESPTLVWSNVESVVVKSWQ